MKACHAIERDSCCVIAVLLTVAFLLLEGCAAGPSQNSAPVDPGTVTITSPASSATVTKLPLTISLGLSNGATLSAMKVTLDGADITSKFTTVSSGTTTAQVSRGVYVGNNRIQVVVGADTNAKMVKSQFTYDPSSPRADPPPPGATLGTLADVIGIQTRVQKTDSKGGHVWGVQVGETFYPAPNGNTDGFQVLILRRSDLSQVFSNSYQVRTDDDVQSFTTAILPGSTQTNACGYAGCLEIVQSLDTIGYDPCPTGPSCAAYQTAFVQIGGTATLGIPQNDAANLAYSFIGNVGGSSLHAGSFFERVTCASGDGCITPALQENSISNQVFLNGIAPNGADGVMPNLAGTGSTGTTNLLQTATMPALTISNNGAMAGELVLDNTRNYTFAYPDPPIHFAMGVAPDSAYKNLLVLTVPPGSTMTFPGGKTTQAVESAALPANPDGSPVGGFRLVVFDAITFQNLANSTYVINPLACPFQGTKNYCTGPDGTPIYHLDQLATDIRSFNSRKNLLFVAGIGNLNHNISVTDPTTQVKYNMQDVWDRVGQAIQDIGGTYPTFVSLNNQAFASDDYDQYTKNIVPQDDYALVGQWWLNDSNVPNPYAMEESSQISRQTEKYPAPSNVQGVLEKENDGYYQVKLHTKYAGMLPDIAFTLAAAPLVPPVQWPLTGPNDSSGVKAAYAWTSQQLLNCINSCTDIRTAYTNLNQSPAIWLTLLSDLESPMDCSGSSNQDCTLNFDSNDFDTVKSQLLTELQYLGVLREYQNNVVGLLLAEQANVSVILQQTTDEVLGNVKYTDNSSSSYGISNWRTDVDDSLSIIGPLAGLGLTVVGVPEASNAVNTAIGITHFALDTSAKHTNDSNGRSLIEQAHDQVAASSLAQKAADQYAQTLTSVGADFARIAKDWGRLQMVGSPIVNNGFVWSTDASGYLLKSFNTAIRRSFYKSLMASGFWVLHFTYSSPGLNPPFYRPGSSGCLFWQGLPNLLTSNPDAYAYLPGALFDGPGATLGPNSSGYYNSLSTGNLFPYDTWWDVWTLQDKNAGIDCVTSDTSKLPSKVFYDTTGLFRPLDPGDPTPLGFYKPWFYQRSGIPVNHGIVGTDTTFWYQNFYSNGPPYIQNNASNWNPDPDNY